MARPFLKSISTLPEPSPGLQRFRFRGLYIDDTWGPDLMTLDDWRHLLDDMAFLEMNCLGVSVYGYRHPQHSGTPNEYLLVPFPEHPDIQAPQTLRWYSPAARGEQTLTYLPPMFEEDFFGHVVAYGRERGIVVRPHVEVLRYSTLIPSAHPEISAKDAAGNPTGYAFCLTSPRTYDVLFSLYDSLIDRYLRPYGATWWHVGLGEAVEVSQQDDPHPGVTGDLWCHCPSCAVHPKSRLLVTYILRSIEHLQSRGITDIMLRHQTLVAVKALPLLREELATRGMLRNVAVQWWRYPGSPPPIQERQMRSWVTLASGSQPERFHHQDGSLIHTMATEGASAGSEGIDAYCTYDPAHFQNYAYIASAGLDPSLHLPAFEDAFTRWLFEGMRVPPAYSHARILFDTSSGPVGSLLNSLLPPRWSDPARRSAAYPQEQIRQLAADPLRLCHALRAAQVQADMLQHACANASPGAADSRRRRLLEEYACEAGTIAGIVRSFLHAATGWNHYRSAERAALRVDIVAALTRANAAFSEAARSTIEVMESIERVKAPFLQPQLLQALTPLHRWLTDTRDRVRTLRKEVEAGGLDEIPPL